MPEPLRHGTRREGGHLPERANAEPLEDLGERLKLWPRAKQGHRKRREEVARRLTGDHDRTAKRAARRGATAKRAARARGGCPPARPCLQRRRMRRREAA